jgi:hypothetical protein
METATARQIVQPNIAEVLAQFLAEEQKRLSAKTFAR